MFPLCQKSSNFLRRKRSSAIGKSAPASFGSAATPLHHRKNSKSPQRIKLACRGGLLNQQQTGPTIPRTLRSVLKVLLSQISLGINFQFQGRDQDASTHTHVKEILLLCSIFFFCLFTLFPSLLLTFIFVVLCVCVCVCVCVEWVGCLSYSLPSTNAWVLFSLLLLLLLLTR